MDQLNALAVAFGTAIGAAVELPSPEMESNTKVINVLLMRLQGCSTRIENYIPPHSPHGKSWDQLRTFIDSLQQYIRFV